MSRKLGERILIGDKISVTVIKIGGGGVRIGIEAPRELPVVREELANQMREQDERSLETARQVTGNISLADESSSDPA